MPTSTPKPPPLSSYLRRLLGFLCMVALFDGYDLYAISQTLPELRAAFGLSPTAGSRLLAVANLGTIAAFLLVRLADRFGRRPLLLLCVTGYSSAALLSALAPGPELFLLGQFAGRFFLVSALAMVVLYASEEYPADRRGRIIGIIQACYSLGAILCAGLTPRLLQAATGWRTVYLLGSVSLALLPVGALILRETRRFQKARELTRPPPLVPSLPRAPYQTRMLQLAMIWLATFICNQSTTVFWKEFARAERGLSNQRIGAWIAIAALVALPLTVLAGRLIDRFGRRRSAVLIYSAAALGTLGSYSQLPEQVLIVSLMLLIAGTSSAIALLNTWTAESFPTELRGDSLAWSSGLIGRLGFVLSPLLVAELVAPLGWGQSLSLMAVFPLLALGLTLLWLPETAGKELEESAEFRR